VLACGADGGVGALDGALDEVDRDVGLLAAVAAHASDAEEVGVAAAVAFGVDEAHARAAACAVEGALEVVLVLAVALLGVPVRVKDRTGLLEGALVDECGVVAFVVHAGVADGADVVGVCEHRGELGAADWFGWPAGCGAGEQPAVCEGVAEGVQRVGAGCVGGECPLDVWGTVGVALHGADFASVDDLADVEVADRGACGGAAALGLLDEPLACLGSEVRRVELGVRGNDRVHEPSEWRVVDVLADGHEFHSGALQGVADRRVVVAVARETVDLVHDHIVEVPLLLHAVKQRA
jgi:hypothetical protein